MVKTVETQSRGCSPRLVFLRQRLFCREGDGDIDYIKMPEVTGQQPVLSGIGPTKIFISESLLPRFPTL